MWSSPARRSRRQAGRCPLCWPTSIWTHWTRNWNHPGAHRSEAGVPLWLGQGKPDIFGLEGWIRRHIRKCFWQRWHNIAGRLRHLKQPGATGRLLKVAHISKGAGGVSPEPESSRKCSIKESCGAMGSYCHRTLRPDKGAAFNRRTLKTARPVVWGEWRAQSRHPDPISGGAMQQMRRHEGRHERWWILWELK